MQQGSLLLSLLPIYRSSTYFQRYKDLVLIPSNGPNYKDPDF